MGVGDADVSLKEKPMIDYFISVMLLIVAVIHLLPLAGVLGASRLASLYGLPFDDPNFVILMRHRAVLLGLLGAFLVCAALRPALQPMAFVAGNVSVLSFLYLTKSVGGYNTQIRRVFVADIVAGVCLVAGIFAYLFA